MEKWAERIKKLLDEGRSRGLTQTGLAKACGMSQPSVSQWFNDNDSKPATAMIYGHNLLSAAKYLGTTPEWIMSGAGPAVASQPAGLDLSTLEVAIVSVKEAVRRAGLEMDAFVVAPMIAFAYRERLALPARLDPSELKAFDEVVWQKLQGELGNVRRTGLVAKASKRGDEKAAPASKKAGRG